MGALDGRNCLVTGGASGIGRETCLLFAAEGGTVWVADLNLAGARETAAMIADAGGTGHALALDVTSEADWLAAIATVQDAGGLDVLLNGAGIELIKTMAETSLEEFRRVQAVNVDGVFLGTKHGTAAMAASGGGSIVNISSVAGLTGHPRQVAYCASKGAVRLLSKAAAVEAGVNGYNVRVNSVHPGIIETPMADELLAHMPDDAARAAARARWAELHPIGRTGKASEVAQAILYLASDASAFVTGSELVIDGGMTAR